MDLPPQRPANPAQLPDLDEDTLAFVRRVFQYARTGAAGELSTLLGQGLPPNLRNERGDSLLMLACYHGHPEAARALLGGGADPEILNDAGQTPLAAAAFKGDAACVSLLLAHGAGVDNAGPNGKTALMIAAMFNRVEIARLLLEHGADALVLDAAGMSIREAAAKMGAQDAVALLDSRVELR
ncbi:ankyrin repeat domain-containing protein [Massilia niabensis]|uniref:Ankyrin repeat domain-containing protein n=1 Tax=Massilia niabensis TaxID=544910 RepID=A0ABW0LAS6_9BURK